MSVDAVTTEQDDTLADLIGRLGVPAERILANPPPGTATEEDVIRLSEREGRLCELTDGVLVEKPMGQEESGLGRWLGFYLCQYLKAYPDPKDRKIGLIRGADAPHRFLPGTLRYPDLAFVSRERVPPESERDRIAPWVPDLVVEILSESNTRREMEEKRRLYFQCGVRLVWYVDPPQRTVRVYHSFDKVTELGEDDFLDGEDVLPGFRLSIREWFRDAEL